MKTVPCKSCRQLVCWVVMAKSGRRMPIDPTPAANGNLVLDNQGMAHVDSQAGRAKFISHFATCPNSQQHRRSR